MEVKQPEQKLKSVNCANCSAPITIFAPNSAVTVGCSHCGTVSALSHDVVSILATYENKLKRALGTDLPIGAKGRFRGNIFQVRGMIAKSDLSEGWWWNEYLLFNPYVGNRWLIYFRGHWTYFTPIKEKPEVTPSGLYAHFRGKKYTIHTSEPSKVQYAIGEFYWEVKPNDQVHSRDFINPPEMLSQETDDGEVSWALGEYVDRHVVQKAFCPTKALPEPVGSVPHQPSRSAPLLMRVGVGSIMAMMVLFILQVATIMTMRGRLLTTYQVMAAPRGAEESEFKSDPFKIPKSRNITVTYQAPVENNWLELEADLVDVQSGKNYQIDSVVEYYSGYDGGESWSEGSRRVDVGIRDLPEGEYVIAGKVANGSTTAVPVAVTLRQNTPSWTLFILFCIPFAFTALFALIFNAHLKQRRWNDSDFQEKIFGSS